MKKRLCSFILAASLLFSSMPVRAEELANEDQLVAVSEVFETENSQETIDEEALEPAQKSVVEEDILEENTQAEEYKPEAEVAATGAYNRSKNQFEFVLAKSCAETTTSVVVDIFKGKDKERLSQLKSINIPVKEGGFVWKADNAYPGGYTYRFVITNMDNYTLDIDVMADSTNTKFEPRWEFVGNSSNRLKVAFYSTLRTKYYEGMLDTDPYGFSMKTDKGVYIKGCSVYYEPYYHNNVEYLKLILDYGKRETGKYQAEFYYLSSGKTISESQYFELVDESAPVEDEAMTSIQFFDEKKMPSESVAAYYQVAAEIVPATVNICKYGEKEVISSFEIAKAFDENTYNQISAYEIKEVADYNALYDFYIKGADGKTYIQRGMSLVPFARDFESYKSNQIFSFWENDLLKIGSETENTTEVYSYLVGDAIFRKGLPTFSIKNTNIAKVEVDKNNKHLAKISAVAPGKTTLVVSAGGVKDTVEINVVKTIKAIAFENESIEIATGAEQFNAISFLPDDVYDIGSATYTTDNKDVATVTAIEGTTTGAMIKAVAPGKTTIHCSYKSSVTGDVLNASCVVEVCKEYTKEQLDNIWSKVEGFNVYYDGTKDIRLSELKLPDGWSWIDESQLIVPNDDGVTYFKAQYKDEGYETVKATIPVFVSVPSKYIDWIVIETEKDGSVKHDYFDLWSDEFDFTEGYCARVYNSDVTKKDNKIVLNSYVIKNGVEQDETAGIVPVSYKSSNTKVATIKKTNKAKEKNKAEIIIKGKGKTTITVTAQDAGKYSQTFELVVGDYKPTLKTNTLNVNYYQELGGLLPLESLGTNITSVTTENEDFKITNTEDGYYIGASDSADVAKFKGKSTVELNVSYVDELDPSKTYTDTISATINKKNDMPKITIKQAGKANLFYTNSVADYNVSASASMENVEIEAEETVFALSNMTNKSFKLSTASNSAIAEKLMASKNKSVAIHARVKLAGYKPIAKDFTFAYTKVAPVFTMDDAVISAGGEGTAIRMYTDKAKKNVADLSKYEIGTFDESDVGIDSERNRIPIYPDFEYLPKKFKFYVSSEEWIESITVQSNCKIVKNRKIVTSANKIVANISDGRHGSLQSVDVSIAGTSLVPCLDGVYCKTNDENPTLEERALEGGYISIGMNEDNTQLVTYVNPRIYEDFTELNGKDYTFKYNLYFTDDFFGFANKVVLSVTVTKKPIKFNVVKSGAIKLSKEASTISYAPKFTNSTEKIIDAYVVGEEADFFEGSWDAKTKKLNVKADHNYFLSTKKNYEVTLMFITEGGRIYKQDVQIKLSK